MYRRWPPDCVSQPAKGFGVNPRKLLLFVLFTSAGASIHETSVRRRADAMNPTTEEENYWREHHANQSYAEKGRPYEDYAAAYRTGYEGFHKYPGRPYQEIENELALDYQRSQPGAALPWDHARHAVHAAWAKLSHDVAPRDPDRGIRSGM
ncbi:MAG: hypothetical protein DME99_05190 [Verrucomicrobia bacterium]|nr:MAG: hypothetical protein DME99_05190 [Verrucomicrobiota bacterium]